MEAASDAAMGQQSQGERAPELPRELGSGCIKRPEWYKPQLINVAECITKPVTKRIGNFNESYKKILIDQGVVNRPTVVLPDGLLDGVLATLRSRSGNPRPVTQLGDSGTFPNADNRL